MFIYCNLNPVLIVGYRFCCNYLYVLLVIKKKFCWLLKLRIEVDGETSQAGLWAKSNPTILQILILKCNLESEKLLTGTFEKRTPEPRTQSQFGSEHMYHSV